MEALEQRPAGAWRAFLDRACGGDAELRAQVERLLERHGAAAASWIGPPLPGLDDHVDHSLRKRPGTLIGPYKLLRADRRGRAWASSTWPSRPSRSAARWR